MTTSRPIHHVLSLLFAFGILGAADPIPGLRATASSNPPSITLQWNGGGSHAIHRSNGIALPVGGGSPGSGWGSPIATVNGTSWTDTSVQVGGSGYEYRVVETSSGRVGYVQAGVELPVVDSRGAIVLVIENILVEPLAFELARLEEDLVGEGYRVLRLSVSRYATPASVRASLQSLRGLNPDLGTVFLIGRVPVQRSGWMNPDGHFSRCFPADTYYADLDGTWTDSTVNRDARSGNLSLEVNVPGDGRPDATYLPSDTDVELGRVDFADMRAFLPATSIDLTRRYLDRDHAWRTGQLTVTHRSANMNGRPDQFQGQLFGTASPTTITGSGIPNPAFWADTEVNDYVLFTKGGGGGFYRGTSGVGSTADYAASPGVKVLINAQSASYYAEWDVEDAYLRAPLAAKGLGLASFYYEIPTWILHHLGTGGTFGRSARISQNNNGYYDQSFQVWGMSNSRRAVFINLLGDPTLRLHVVAPPASVRRSGATITWSASPGAGVAGYHVYRASSAADPFQRLTASPVSGTTYTDPNPPAGSPRYRVRAVKLETIGGSGSWWNSSVGILADLGPQVVAVRPDSRTSILVSFDRALSPSSAQTVSHYAVSGGLSPGSATLLADQRTVRLAIPAQTSGASYGVTVTGVTATGPAPVPSASSLTYVYSELPELVNDAATIALYRLDGNGQDASGNGHHLTLGSNVSFTDVSPYGPAKLCLQIQGSDTSGTHQATASIPDSAILPSGRPITFEAAVRIAGVTASGLMNANILSLAQESWNGTKLRPLFEGRWDVAGDEFRAPRTVCADTTLISNGAFRDRVPLDRWVRLAMEYDGGTSAFFYLDGQQIAGPVTVANYVGSTQAWALVLGNFVGCIDEVRISSVRRSSSGPVLPAAPTDLTASAGNAQVSLSWSAVNGAASYTLKRSTSASGPFTVIASGLTGTSRVDTGLANGTTYAYVVAAVNSAGTGPDSSIATATPSAPITLPTAPVVSATTATPATVTGATSALNATASDDGGEGALTYTWSGNPGTVTFSPNGTNSAKTSTATFSAAGSYVLTVTARDGDNLTGTRTVDVTVQQTATAVTVSSPTATVAANATTTLSAQVRDQFDAVISGGTITWSVLSGGGSVDAAGVYTAPGSAGTAVVQAAHSGHTATVTVTITAGAGNQTPVVSAAMANPSPVTASTTSLSATATDDGGEAALTYTWSGSPASVTFSPNGTNAAKTSTATFSAAGSYVLTVTARDADNLTGTRTVAVTVQQTPTTMTVPSATATVAANATVALSAQVRDQFNAVIPGAPITWSVQSGGGSVNGAGVYTAASTAGTAVVRAANGPRSGTITVTITDGGGSNDDDDGNSGGGESCGFGVGMLALLLGGLLFTRRHPGICVRS